MRNTFSSDKITRLVTSKPSLKKTLKAGAAALLATGLMATSAQAQSVYSFGDSLSDIGNVDTVTLGLVQGDDYFNGRFSNGFIWVDWINAWVGSNSQRLSPLLIDPFASTTRAYNFAHGGAISARNGINFVSIFGNGPTGALQLVPAFRLDRQARHFRDETSFFLDSYRAGADDFATISIGGNDYINGERNVNFVVDSTITSINYIRQGGIRNFFVLALPNLGLVPQEAGGSDAPVLSSLSAQHNNLLSSRINSFEAQTGTQVSFVRIDRLFDFIIWDADNNNGSIFGFDVVRAGPGTTGQCLADGLVLNACPDSYLSYDGLHPTRSAHYLIAQLSIAQFNADLTARTSSLGRVQSISRQATNDNSVIGARLSAARQGFAASGFFTNGIHAGTGQLATGGLGFQGTTTLAEEAGFSFYRYTDGHAPEYAQFTPGDSFNQKDLVFSLDLARGEYVSSYGADYLVPGDMVIGGLFSRAARRDDAFGVARFEELNNMSVYGALFRGPWTFGLTSQISHSEQESRRSSGLSYLSPIEAETRSQATTTRAETTYAKALGRFRFEGKSRTSFTRVVHDGYEERTRFGVLDVSVDDSQEDGFAAYLGAGVETDMRLASNVWATLSAEIGGLASSSAEIGFSPVLEDTGLLRDDIGNFGLRDPFRGTAREGGYLALGLDVNARNRMTFSAQASAVSTDQGTTPVARLSATYRF